MPLGERPVFKRWLEYDVNQLLEKLADVNQHLWGMEQEYALAVAEENKAKYNEYFNADFTSSSHAAREMAARRAAIPAFMTMHEIDGNRKSLLYEKAFLELILRVKHNVG